MQLFKTSEIKLKKFNMRPRNMVITPSLVFTNIQTEFDEQNQFSIIENYQHWIDNQLIPNWVETLLHLYNDTGAIFNFKLPQLEGWHTYNLNIHKTNSIADEEKYYLLLKNKFPITRWQDFQENLEYSQEKKILENSELLKTGWPLEIHIYQNSVGLYCINKKSKAVEDIKKILPEHINLEILTSSAIIGETLTDYINYNSNNFARFFFREEISQSLGNNEGLQQLCLGSLSAPETVVRNLISNLAKIQAKLPDSILKIVRF